jgi:hypothetical protein
MRDGKEVMLRPGQKAGFLRIPAFHSLKSERVLHRNESGKDLQDRFTGKIKVIFPPHISVRGEICEAVFCLDRTQLYMINVVVASPANGDHDGGGHRGRECRLFPKA